ncbi:MAG TPA: helix-turn-helix domain-containing protein [Candidatus Bathyarchaeia archaeon]|nr:helix-turn-helix domain-containing protein [Candidatus Bathyarchaeia archaeon]
MKAFLNAAEIARIEGVDKSTVTIWIKKGYFKNVVRVGNRGQYRIPLSSYEEFKKEKIQKVEPK